MDWIVRCVGVLLVCAGVALFVWAGQPSPLARPDMRYNICLETVLRHGTLADAETMCKHYREAGK